MISVEVLLVVDYLLEDQVVVPDRQEFYSHKFVFLLRVQKVF